MSTPDSSTETPPADTDRLDDEPTLHSGDPIPQLPPAEQTRLVYALAACDHATLTNYTGLFETMNARRATTATATTATGATGTTDDAPDD